MRRKLFVLLCCIALAASSVVPSFADTSDVHHAEKLMASADATQYLKSTDEAAKVLRQNMTQRKSDITVKYYTASNEKPDVNQIIEEIFDKACEHTGKSNEGDALRWDWKTWDCDVAYQVTGNEYYYDFHYVIIYYTNDLQEARLQEAIKQLKTSLSIDKKSDYEKVKAIYDYICSNVKYDYFNLNNTSYDLKYSAYAALVNKTSVCQGYATLFYRLALEYGIDARVISGVSFGQTHGWNIVKLGNQYYYLDATWDSQRDPDEYFLRGMNFLKEDHSCNDDFMTSSFTAKYPIAKSDYVVDSPNADTQPAPELKPEVETVSAIGTVKLSIESAVYNQKTRNPKVVVKDTSGSLLKKGTDYEVTTPKGRKNVGKYTYVVNFLGKYQGTKSKKLTLTIKPVKPVIGQTKAAKNAVTVKWKKVKKQADGYQVMVATDKKFKKNLKRVILKKNTVTSKKISKLKAKKTYYVKVRSYKTVKGSKIYSAWSKVKTVKVK